MNKRRPPIGRKKKEQLVTEAGGKCANPGCPNSRVHIHHIREWAIYHTHDLQDMIAVCPACHDQIHHGAIPLDDDLLRSWKTLHRNSNHTVGHFYIEPSVDATQTPKLLLGSLAVASKVPVFVFSFSKDQHLRFEVKDQDILILNLTISNVRGEQVLRLVDNHIRHHVRADVVLEKAPGAISLVAPNPEEFMPQALLHSMRIERPGFAKPDLTLLNMRVLKPGLVSIAGTWVEGDKAIVVTDQGVTFASPGLRRPLTFSGQGENTVFHCTNGMVNKSIFGFSDE